LLHECEGLVQELHASTNRHHTPLQICSVGAYFERTPELNFFVYLMYISYQNAVIYLSFIFNPPWAMELTCSGLSCNVLTTNSALDAKLVS